MTHRVIPMRPADDAAPLVIHVVKHKPNLSGPRRLYGRWGWEPLPRGTTSGMTLQVSQSGACAIHN
jgi:hypothetical protein